MPEPLRAVPASALVAGCDFSTGSVKGLLFDTTGTAVAEVRLPTDLWTEGGVSELSALQLEGQARALLRGLAAAAQKLGRLHDWHAIGISATHHTAGRVDADLLPVRRLICWNDQTLAKYHAAGLERLGGQERARELTGGPWAVRYSLSHLVKDEETLPADDWKRTRHLVQHGGLTAAYYTGRADAVSVSAAASTGMLDLRTEQWSRGMLDALARPESRESAWNALPAVVPADVPLGPVLDGAAHDAGLPAGVRPLVFPTIDDQAAGLVGGGAVDAGQVAVILGNSAVVNSSSSTLPASGTLDAMRTNWGTYLWMRCYSNGAQFLDRVVGRNPDWPALEAASRAVPAGCGGGFVLPFALSEPSVGVYAPRVEWSPTKPVAVGEQLRMSFEAIAYLIALGVREHEAAGQVVGRVTVSGGIAKSGLMLEILASVLGKPVVRLASGEGPALGAAVTALAGLEATKRREAGDAAPYRVADAVAQLVQFRDTVAPNPSWAGAYRDGLAGFAAALTSSPAPASP